MRAFTELIDSSNCAAVCLMEPVRRYIRFTAFQFTSVPLRVTLVGLRRGLVSTDVVVPMIWSTAGVNASKRCGGGGGSTDVIRDSCRQHGCESGAVDGDAGDVGARDCQDEEDEG